MCEKVKKILSVAMFAGIGNFMNHPGCFELLEANFIIDENYNPWLIRFNRSPVLETKTKVEKGLIPSIV